jgi:polyisoprenoid-binding protein YceI
MKSLFTAAAIGSTLGRVLFSAVWLCAAATHAAHAAPASAAPVPAGSYALEKSHASLLFSVDHLGFSHYTARFKQFDAQLQFDPNNLAASKLTATVDARSIETDFPDPAKIDFNAMLRGDQWLNAGQFPEMTFRSTKVEVLGAGKMRVCGDFTLHGITKPLVLETTYNGGYAGHPMDPHARIGFSARGALLRSDYGINFGIPSPGSKMGVSDRVDIVIEVEFSGPPLPGATAAPH